MGRGHKRLEGSRAMKPTQQSLFPTQPEEVVTELSPEDFLRLCADRNWRIQWIDVLRPSGYRVKARRVCAENFEE